MRGISGGKKTRIDGADILAAPLFFDPTATLNYFT